SAAVTGDKSSPQYLQVARYRFDSPEEIRQVELLVGRVKIVIRKSEAHHDAGYTQELVEDADNRDASARSNVNGISSEGLLQSFGGRMDEGIIGVSQRGRA